MEGLSCTVLYHLRGLPLHEVSYTRLEIIVRNLWSEIFGSANGIHCHLMTFVDWNLSQQPPAAVARPAASFFSLAWILLHWDLSNDQIIFFPPALVTFNIRIMTMTRPIRMGGWSGVSHGLFTLLLNWEINGLIRSREQGTSESLLNHSRHTYGHNFVDCTSQHSTITRIAKGRKQAVT